MKILYLHGYQGSPNWGRIDYLKSLDHEVISPQIDYDNNNNFFNDLLDEDYDFIVGNSLGGFVSFYLSMYKGKPCICINPPLYMDLKIKINLPKFYEIKGCNDLSIIMGSDDDVVSPTKTFNWLTENKPTANVKIVEGMSHKFNLETFTEFTKPILDRFIF